MACFLSILDANRVALCSAIAHDRYTYIVDPISREQLNILKQCVSLMVISGNDKKELIQRKEFIDQQFDEDIARERQVGVRKRRGTVIHNRKISNVKAALDIDILAPENMDKGNENVAQLVVLGAAATGKSTLMRHYLVSYVERLSDANALVPILVLMIDLGRLMAKHDLRPDTHDLLLEHLKDVYGEFSMRYRALARCWEEGRVLLLMDGLDEAGDMKQPVEIFS